jgi:alkyldihydroxyacetonephosphate synthase
MAIMVLAFESGDHPVEPWMTRARECCGDHGGTTERTNTADAHREGAAGVWRNAFIRMPYARERTIERGIINDTFETAITWERFESFHDKVKAATERAIVEATGRAGQVTCRCTHVYPDGPAPYFTFQAAGRHGELIAQWHTIKSAGLDAVIANGGPSRTIMRSGGTIGGGTIASAHRCSRMPSGRPRRPWTRRACSIREC